MLARVRISSPQIRGEVEVKVEGKPKLILVNGHWNSLLNMLNASPGEGESGYWTYFLGNKLEEFIVRAWDYFGHEVYEKKPLYIDGSSLFGGDQSGEDRKQLGYQYALKHFAQIVEGVGTEKIYLISHSEGCAFAAGVGKALIQKGYRIGESIFLSADEGDEFFVEGDYPSYQIVGARIAVEETFPAYVMNQPDDFSLGPIKIPNKTKRKGRLGKSNFFVKRKRLYLDPMVSDYRIAGVTRYGIYIYPKDSLWTVHAATIRTDIFEILRELKSIQVQSEESRGNSRYKIKERQTHNWHKIDNNFIDNSKVDIYHDGKKVVHRR